MNNEPVIIGGMVLIPTKSLPHESVRNEPECFGDECNECWVFPCDGIMGGTDAQA